MFQTVAVTSSPLVNLSLTTLAITLTELGWKTRWESWVLRPSSQWSIIIHTWLKSLKTWPSSKQAYLVRRTNCRTTGTGLEEWYTDHISSTTGNILLWNVNTSYYQIKFLNTTVVYKTLRLIREQEWRSGESTCLPPCVPGSIPGLSVVFRLSFLLVLSLLKVSFPGSPVFLPPPNQHLQAKI